MYRTIQIDKLLPTSPVLGRGDLIQLEEAYASGKQQQIPPIEVVGHPARKGYFLIVNGHHRTYIRAHKRLKTIKCEIRPPKRWEPNFSKGMAKSYRELAEKGVTSISDLVINEASP